MYSKNVLLELERLELIQRKYVSKQEQKELSKLEKSDLPEDIYWGAETNRFWRYSEIPTEDKLKMLLDITNARNIQTIKNCAMFFIALAIIGIVLAIVV